MNRSLQTRRNIAAILCRAERIAVTSFSFIRRHAKPSVPHRAARHQYSAPHSDVQDRPSRPLRLRRSSGAAVAGLGSSRRCVFHAGSATTATKRRRSSLPTRVAPGPCPIAPPRVRRGFPTTRERRAEPAVSAALQASQRVSARLGGGWTAKLVAAVSLRVSALKRPSTDTR